MIYYNHYIYILYRNILDILLDFKISVCNYFLMISWELGAAMSIFDPISSSLLLLEKALEPLRANEYVMDVISTLDRKRLDYHLHFRRVLWFKKFRFENKLLIDMFYNQVSLSVKSGDLLGGQSFDVQLHNEVALLNAIEYRMQGKRNPPVL